MAKKVFSSYRSGKSKDATEIQQLIVEVGTKHMACIVKSGSKEIVRDFELFKFDSSDTFDFEKAYDSVAEHSELLKHSYSETKLFINNETALLAPSHGFSKDSMNNYLNIVYGEKPEEEVFVDTFTEEGINNVYRISKGWMAQLNSALNIDGVRHTYSNIIEQLFNKAAADGSVLKVAFYEDHIIVAIFHNKKLNLIQTFEYQATEDILYHLLNFFQQFHLSEEHTHVLLSGNIDVKSSLFADLKKHFKRISLEEMDLKKIEVNLADHSKHYFTPFFNLAK